ncbi:DNA topoisomerase IV [Algoriphagus aestuariicola]|uniref:DNA topoisomerase IV n=1 Tax=Algoriphagus aestuariicola TaxID=1852016 RepID=A0ABS3BN30_9BACT|nr:DNA topoisomerase IV [Algoriphagus aestuariicola]MBN7800681.1 DNA topoisomerase IV [Algoriphagus aestuariicola]
MYYRFGKVFYFTSILLFVFFLLYFYSALTETIGLSVDENGTVARTVDKSSFFYGTVAIFLILNAFTLFTPKSLETKSNKKLHRIFPIGDPFRDYLLTWFYSFGGIINLSLALLVFFVHSINNQEVIASSQFNFFFYLMPLLLAIWVIGLAVLLVGKFKQIQKGA